MNLGEVQFISDHLSDEECRKLILILMRYESENDIPHLSCLENLIRWDRTYGRGKPGVTLYTPLCQVGREDLANELSKMISDEMIFEFEHSPFHVGDGERSKTLAPGEVEVKEGETLEEAIEEYKREIDEEERNIIEKKTGFTILQLFFIICASIIGLATLYTLFLADIQWLNDWGKSVKDVCCVYYFGIINKPLDRPHYDPAIHDIPSSFI